MTDHYTQPDNIVNTHMVNSSANNAEMSIKNELQARMERAGLNPHSLATKTKVPQATIWRILNGESKEPKESTVTKLARFFGITNDELWGRGGKAHGQGDTLAPALSPRQQALIGLFDGLTEDEQDKVIRDLQASQQAALETALKLSPERLEALLRQHRAA